MKRHVSIVLATIIFALALCSSASAAVSLGFTEAGHLESEIHHGDGVVSYSLKLKNTGTTVTEGATNVSVALPGGVRFAAGGAFLPSGQLTASKWTCHASAQTCSYSAAAADQVAPGAEFGRLEIKGYIMPEAPQTIVATFTAFGGGATTDAVTSHSFTLLPEKPFELLNFGAGSCTQPPAVPGSGICSSILGSTYYTQAGGHPFAATSRFALPTHIAAAGDGEEGGSKEDPVQELRSLYFELPPGFIGNLQVVSPCAISQLQDSACPTTSAIGGINSDVFFPNNRSLLYRLTPEEGYVAAFGFQPVELSPLSVVLRVKLRSNGDYGVTAIAPLPPQSPPIIRVNHATLCGYGVKSIPGPTGPVFDSCKNPGDPGASAVPFVTNPTTCAGELPVTRAHADSYQHPATFNDEGFPDLSDPDWKSASATSPQGTDCEGLTEAWTGMREPSFTFRPDSSRAAAAASYAAHLHIDQEGLVEEHGIASSHLKDTTVVLPEGVVLNPSAADGLGACTPQQAGYLGNDFPAPNPIHFKTNSAGCPENSRIGVVEVSTPILDDSLPGAIYLASQDDNPFGSRFALYLVVDEKVTGIKATIAGKVSPDPRTGRITATFPHNPQAPVEDLTVDFFDGPRASLSNPDLCGNYTTQVQLTPWSAKDPYAPLPSEIADPSDTVAIDAPPAGAGSCPSTKAGRPFAPTFAARATNPTAGAHSQFTLRMTRPEGQQEFDGVRVTTPPGFAATLKGVATCSDAALAAAAAKTGKAEMASPSCPAASQVGTTTIGAGSGPSPYYVKTGKVYLTGPYKGAPLSFSFVVPAVAGPFDLGVQLVRTALDINPKTAAVTAVSDPIPQILDGVPLQIRDIRVDLDRPNFTLNPTSCAVMSISGALSGASGGQSNPTARFQVGGCDKLGFKPKLKLTLHGSPKRAAYQRLEATVTARPGDANIARTAVTLPHSAFLAQEHIRTVCTRVQFAADTCPPGSVYGNATAITPLFDEPLSGPVYLRSSDNKLPDLVVALRGPNSMPIEVELAGRTDSVNGGIRNTFDIVPDAPVSKFTLRLFGGKKSLIVNSRDLCKGTQRATVRMGAQNGLEHNFRPVVANDCKKKGKGKKAARQSRAEARRAVVDLLQRFF